MLKPGRQAVTMATRAVDGRAKDEPVAICIGDGEGFVAKQGRGRGCHLYPLIRDIVFDGPGPGRVVNGEGGKAEPIAVAPADKQCPLSARELPQSVAELADLRLQNTLVEVEQHGRLVGGDFEMMQPCGPQGGLVRHV